MRNVKTLFRKFSNSNPLAKEANQKIHAIKLDSPVRTVSSPLKFLNPPSIKSIHVNFDKIYTVTEVKLEILDLKYEESCNKLIIFAFSVMLNF